MKCFGVFFLWFQRRFARASKLTIFTPVDNLRYSQTQNMQAATGGVAFYQPHSL